MGDKEREALHKKFEKMMSALYKQNGANLDINILASDEAQDFITEHAAVLDGSFKKVEMTEGMRRRLTRSNYIFSGIKTFHELNEAFPSLLDENGDRKPFERFLNDVQKIDKSYNSNYLRAEYNFIHSSAEMAAKWEGFMEDGDRYNLQYRTQHDDKVRPEHAALDGVTLPPSDPFWEEYYPPNGWNCRCTVVQVRRSKYPATPHDEAMALGEEALQRDTKGIFHFNPGKEQKSVPDYNPYTIRRCRDCDVAKGKTNLAYVPENELCAACKLLHLYQKSESENCAKATRNAPEVKRIQGKTITNPGFAHEVLVSGKSIKEWTNQPHKFFLAKNKLLRNIAEVFAKAKYIGVVDNFKNRPGIRQSHIFETMIGNEPSWIIVREYETGEFILHSISDGEKIKSDIRKE